ncbi:diguanylate cyclase (GGDEF)-like protein [Saccharopolyspora lacisalsi]|uniref:Diguanylate cyclase (GGDEF)-like protein n=1 Tax=Halosaccharopolyspora lacisalsi TaxID=1000566 RepID=A0A839E1M5_9PSEU|nr:GGDEF domain-containing protein [Halosaccharopolyspora lacisalsi]MBA8825301.1 diguanylate cyclase (GGDEF)-like protein [Halosaccharopolyspora lacisalsi]
MTLDPNAVLAVASSGGFLTAGLRVRQLRRQLRTDPLTGLGNRTGLQHAFARTRARPGYCVTALMVDLDDFKAINDTHGHRVGDQVLVEVARRLRRHQHRGQLAVRISGDEFALWLGRFRDTPRCWIAVQEHVRAVAASIVEPMSVDGQRLFVTASVGGSIVSSTVTGLEDVLEPADRAMYGEKTSRTTRREVS